MNIINNHSSVRNRFKIFRRMIYTILLLIVSIILVMCFCDMEDIVEGDGNVVGIREYDLKTLVTAKTKEIFYHDGAGVKAGEILLRFDDRDQQDKIKTLENELQQLRQQHAVKLKEFKILSKDPLPSHYRHTKLQLAEAQERFLRNEHELQVYSDLYKRKAITRREYLRVELDHLASKMTLKRLNEDWKTLESGMVRDILDKAGEELQLLLKHIAAKEHEIKVAKSHLDDYLLRAPDDGIVTDIPPRAGGYFERGEVVVKFSANRYKKVVALVDEKQIFKVAPGQTARIYCQQYNYLDYGYFTGKVTNIYQLPVKIGNRNCYPVRIVLVDEPHPLRFGSSCEVKIITGQDKIICVILGIRGKDFWERRGIRRK